jgi:NAD(P)-dependent dehydrogenase (short-subunit alcohol dehydrogenase family)
VLVTDVDGDAAARVAEELASQAPERVASRALDVRDPAQAETAVGEVVERWGSLDWAANNAGVSTMARFVDLTESEWDQNFDINTKGVFNCLQAEARRMLAQGRGGRIVNTASLAAKVGAPLLAHYSASKFAVVGLTQAVAQELAPQGIRVNAVCPGWVVTSMQEREIVWEGQLRSMQPEAVRDEYLRAIPLGRLELPDDVARVVVMLLSDYASYMTGQAISVTGGAHMD